MHYCCVDSRKGGVGVLCPGVQTGDEIFVHRFLSRMSVQQNAIKRTNHVQNKYKYLSFMLPPRKLDAQRFIALSERIHQYYVACAYTKVSTERIRIYEIDSKEGVDSCEIRREKCGVLG